MARTVRILDLDSETQAELDRRARAAGMSIDAYLTALATQHVRRSHVDDWLQRRASAGNRLPSSAVHEAFGDRSA